MNSRRTLDYRERHPMSLRPSPVHTWPDVSPSVPVPDDPRAPRVAEVVDGFASPSEYASTVTGPYRTSGRHTAHRIRVLTGSTRRHGGVIRVSWYSSRHYVSRPGPWALHDYTPGDTGGGVDP